jgi:thioredoxin
MFLIALVSCNGQSGKAEAAKNNKVTSVQVPDLQKNEISVSPVHLTKEDFLKLVMNYEKNTNTWKFEGDKPCVVDFYADWCAPCRITSPILEDLARQYAGRINVYKINIDKEQELAAVFGIQNIPTFLFCPVDGEPTLSSGIANTPAATKQMFIDQIEELLLKTTGNSSAI